MTAARLHSWRSTGSPPFHCHDCGAPASGSGAPAWDDPCLAPGKLQRRVDALLDEARALSIDLRAARDAAPDGGKAGYRLANQRVEQAIAKLAQAAEVKL